MYGLENQKAKKANEPFIFDLEKDIKDKKKLKEIKEIIESRVQKVKSILQSGENKESFDQYGILLHGYTSLLKVVARCVIKS